MEEPCLRQSTQPQEGPTQTWAPQYALPQNIQSRPLGDITFQNDQLQNMGQTEDHDMDEIDGRPTIVAQVSTPKTQNKQ